VSTQSFATAESFSRTGIAGEVITGCPAIPRLSFLRQVTIHEVCWTGLAWSRGEAPKALGGVPIYRDLWVHGPGESDGGFNGGPPADTVWA
jgi:hypothetical protein